MRDHESAPVEERTRGADIDSPAAQVVGETGEVGDLRREGLAGVLAVHLCLVVQDLDDAPVEGVRER